MGAVRNAAARGVRTGGRPVTDEKCTRNRGWRSHYGLIRVVVGRLLLAAAAAAAAVVDTAPCCRSGALDKATGTAAASGRRGWSSPLLLGTAPGVLACSHVEMLLV